MVHVLISDDDGAVEAARRSDPHAVVMDLDEPFDEVVNALMPRGEVPGPGFLAQARRNAEARQAFLDAHGALTAEEVADFAESSAGNRRQTAHRWASDRRIFAVVHRGQTLYPGFQLDAGTRRPRSGVKTALEALPAGMTGWALALWWDTPVLDGEEWVSPLDLIDDPERLARVADAEAAGWRHDGAA